MNIDTLIRDLDTLGIVEEIPNFNHKISWPGFTNKVINSFEHDFSTNSEYAAAQKFNDENRGKLAIVGADLIQEVHLNNEIGWDTPYWRRYIHASIYLSDGNSLRTFKVGTNTQRIGYFKPSQQKPSNFAIETIDIKHEHMEFLTIPIIEYTTLMALKNLKSFRDKLWK